MKNNVALMALLACTVLISTVFILTVNAEITPPPNDIDPGTETPTNTSLGMTIDTFSMTMSSTETTYTYTIEAAGTGSADIVKGYYSIWVYGGDGESGAQESWEASPIDEEHSYGSHEYKEEFFGTGPEGSWSTWKWKFHSSGPIDDSNRARFEDPESYWGPIDHMLLYIRGYAEDGTWDQDSEDITEEYTGIPSSSSDDDTTDDDTTDDDTTDDDTTDDDTNDEKKDDSPGFEFSIIALGLIITMVILVRRRKP